VKHTYIATVVCENNHETCVHVTPILVEDGVLKQGLMGSSGDFCDACDGIVTGMISLDIETA
jgi:hypothetical protein